MPRFHLLIAAVALPSLASGLSCTAPAQQPTVPAATQPTSQPATAPANSQAADGAATSEKIVKPSEGVTVFINVDPSKSRVEIKAYTCLDSGWLEQVACMPGTREHESLLVVNAKPSQVHAALLMADFKPGRPGRWTYDNQKFGAVDPTGDKVTVLVRYTNKEGKTVEHDVDKWIREPVTRDKDGNEKEGKPFPKEPWVFGGSILAPNTADMGPGEHYVADMTGSVIGLVTFGDETIGFSRVLSDQEAVQEPEWEANTEAMPEPATPVTVIIRKWQDA